MRHVWRWCVFILFVALVSLVRSDISSYKAISSTAITAAELKEHVRYLASDELEGRGAGTKGAEMAREYIATLFAEWGLRPMGDNGTYFQRFSFPGRLRLGEGNLLELTLPDGQKRTFAPEKEFLPLALSANGEVEGEIVFVGYGISAPDKNYDDYAGIDVSGKIVLALRGMPANDTKFAQEATFPAKLRTAREKGAKALILVSGPLSPFDDEPVPFWTEPVMRDAGILGVSVKRAFAEALEGRAENLGHHCPRAGEATKRVKNWKGETKMARVVRCDRSRPYLIQVGGQNIAICACGLSKNKPYCDGTHKITRDEEAGKIYAYDEQRNRIVVQVTDENGNTVTLPAETVDE